MENRRPICHSWFESGDVAPCGEKVELGGPGVVGDSFSASMRFINCPKCETMVRRGMIRVVGQMTLPLGGR
jgi:hypothetical protein